MKRRANGALAVKGPESLFRGATATFDYGGELRTLVASSREAAFAAARQRWGDGWQGEPVVTTVDSIYRDVTGYTAERWAQANMTRHDGTAMRREQLRREGRL